MNQFNQWLRASKAHSPTDDQPAGPPPGAEEGTKPAITPGIELMPLEARRPSKKSSASMAPATPSAGGGRTSYQFPRLMWCVNLSSQLTVRKSVKIHWSDKDQEIFKKLRIKYWKVRGWRRWFSLYTISTIKFVKVWNTPP